VSKPVILLYEDMHPRAIEELREHAEVRMANSLDENDLVKVVADVEGIIIRANGVVSRRVMEAAPKLKVVARHGTGVEAIDREAAEELGIVVVNTPEANVESVAEQCLGFMLILGKRMRAADRAIRAGDWGARYRLIGTEIYGKTLGMIGFGRIGQRVAEMAYSAFAMQIVYHDLVSYPDTEAELKAKAVSLDELLKSADFVSVHVPLLPTTRGMINSEVFAAMKPSAYLINSSRGAVVDQDALIEALNQGLIAGAGLDVFDPEPLPGDHPLYQMDNVILSPHMAGHTDEALYRMAQAYQDVLAVIEGRAPTYPVR
jgi:D-3-phosphoglycerate dehydrogenase